MTNVIIILVSLALSILSLGCAAAYGHFDAKGDIETKQAGAAIAIASQVAVLALMVTI